MISAVLDSISRNLMAGFFMFAGTGVLIWLMIRVSKKMAEQDEALEDRIASIESEISFLRGRLGISETINEKEHRKETRNESGKDDQNRRWNSV